jgi:hypothetical protein
VGVGIKAKITSRVKIGWVGAYPAGKIQAATSLSNLGRRSTIEGSQPSCGKIENEPTPMSQVELKILRFAPQKISIQCLAVCVSESFAANMKCSSAFFSERRSFYAAADHLFH